MSDKVGYARGLIAGLTREALEQRLIECYLELWDKNEQLSELMAHNKQLHAQYIEALRVRHYDTARGRREAILYLQSRLTDLEKSGD